ncbi:hypothetical protein SAY87_012968 [Trapa incisa]|uniref:Uncharacterized protein n=2 Tax=Trapa TaxID=22665 RepID=A0AAN7K737_TRANT|nr:hypothetical protein SAY86_008846 [Trapa natans]KAK4763530.1 hypothetical protein SAY87_012968 [Trapa incisa]
MNNTTDMIFFFSQIKTLGQLNTVELERTIHNKILLHKLHGSILLLGELSNRDSKLRTPVSEFQGKAPTSGKRNEREKPLRAR